jgi:hypothetical protein
MPGPHARVSVLRHPSLRPRGASPRHAAQGRQAAGLTPDSAFDPASIRMQPQRPLSPGELPRPLIYATALSCGVLAAMALQIQLERMGADLVGLGRTLFSGGAIELRAAGPWWAIASLAFIVGGASAAALARLPLPWRRFRLLRWAAGAGIVLLLAHIGHSAAAGPSGVGAFAELAATLLATAVAALMAMLGAYFTAGRR